MSELISNVSLAQSLKPLSPLNDTKSVTVEKSADNSFDSIFQAYIDMYDQTNTLQLSAEQLQLDYASGKTDDMVSVILAQEKAYTSLNFTIQVTNKIIEAYREIMRMQL